MSSGPRWTQCSGAPAGLPRRAGSGGASRRAAAVRHPAPRPFGCPSHTPWSIWRSSAYVRQLHLTGHSASSCWRPRPHVIARKGTRLAAGPAPCAEHPGVTRSASSPSAVFRARPRRLLRRARRRRRARVSSYTGCSCARRRSKCQDGAMRWLASAIAPVLEGPPVGGPAPSVTPYPGPASRKGWA